MAKARDLRPDEQARARDTESEGIVARDQEADVEGHSMLISPVVGRELAKARSADIERSVRSKNQEAEAKRVFRR